MSEMVCPSGFILAVEGLAKICIPDPDLYRREDGSYEPSWAPVFYNPRMVGNRDVCVAFLKVELVERGGEAAILDPLAATGVRGIRIALEVGIPRGSTAIYMGDISQYAVEIMKHNIKLNGVEEGIAVVHADANELMYQLVRSGIALGYIDIDPFGSPAPFMHAAIESVRRCGVVAVTATDLAVLEGRYRSKLYRRYGVVGTKAVQSKDIALRTLLSFIMRVAAIYDRYIEPLVSYAMNHYIRVYIRVYRGGSKASETLNNCLGSIWCCTRCGYHYIQKGDGPIDSVQCPVCGDRLERVHPVWVCPIVNRGYLEKLVGVAGEMQWLQKSSRVLLESLYNTSTVNGLTTRLTHIARAIKTNTPPINTVIGCLSQKGFVAVRSYTYSDGIVTNAPINDVVECVKLRATP